MKSLVAPTREIDASKALLSVYYQPENECILLIETVTQSESDYICQMYYVAKDSDSQGDRSRELTQFFKPVTSTNQSLLQWVKMTYKDPVDIGSLIENLEKQKQTEIIRRPIPSSSVSELLDALNKSKFKSGQSPFVINQIYQSITERKLFIVEPAVPEIEVEASGCCAMS